MSEYIKNYLTEVKQICDTVDIAQIEKFSDILIACRRNGGRSFFLGVGGSAGNCSHAVNDFRKILNLESYCITDNASELTARINDEGWDTCFSNYLKGSRLASRDVVIVFSVGGGSTKTSQNIVKGVEYAKAVGAKVCSVVSRDGGYTKLFSDACVHIPPIANERITPHAEEWQGIIFHLIVNYITHENKNIC
ncbi:SIS domain-containing protein [bacterium]|nr:SIS domain-containing protein [bacterium]